MSFSFLSVRSLCLRVRKSSLQHDGTENNCAEGGELRRTRIIRPDEKISQVEEPAIKGIRGRRRVLYPVRVAPACNGPNRPPAAQPPSTTITTAAVTSPPKNTAVARTSSQSRGRSASPASPSPVRPNRTSALRQTTTQTQKTKTSPMDSLQVRLRPNNKSPRVSSAPCSPRQPPQMDETAVQQLKRRSLEVTCKTGSSPIKSSPPKSESVNLPVDPAHPPLATLGKQGTFTKEKPSTSEPPKEEEQIKVPPKVPPKPKLPSTATKPALPKKPARFNGGPSPLSSPRSKGSPALSRRSVSSASIGSDSTVTTTCSGLEDAAASATPPLKRTPPKKVVASKISQLWKQVEESRNKEKTAQPDVRKWISRGDSAKANTEEKTAGAENNSACQPPEAAQSLRPVVSSSTFEKLSSFTNTPLPVITDKRSPPSRLPFRLPRFGRSASSSASTTPITPTLPTPPSPSFDIESGSQEAEDKRKFRVTAL